MCFSQRLSLFFELCLFNCYLDHIVGKGNQLLSSPQINADIYAGRELAYSKDNDSRPKWAMSLPFLIDIIRSFSNLALPPHQMAKGAEEFLGLLDDT